MAWRSIFPALRRFFPPVMIPVIAIQGKNVDKIIPAALDRPPPPVLQVNYDHHVEACDPIPSGHARIDPVESLQALQGLGRDEQVRESAAIPCR